MMVLPDIIRRRSSADKGDGLNEFRRFSQVSNQEDHLNLPSFHSLNPHALEEPVEGTTWRPIKDLIDSKESIYLRQSIGNILENVNQYLSDKDLEIRANTPEYRLEKDDWIAHNKSKNAAKTMKSVARLPMNLLTAIPDTPSISPFDLITGHLSKRGNTNTAFKRRYFELEQKILSYFRSEPTSLDHRAAFVTGTIPLETVSAVQPHNDPSIFGFELVTPTRTWVLAADTEAEYMRWVDAICHQVDFNSVNVVFRRMVQLPEVSADGINEVRMVVLPKFTVADTVKHIFDRYAFKLNSVPLHPFDPADFALKITGYRDYLIDPNRELHEYHHVSECLLTRKTLCLTIVHRSKIDGSELLTNSPSFESQTSFQWQSFTQLNRESCVASSICHDPLRFCIHRVLHIPTVTTHLKRDAHEMGVETRPLLYSNATVVIELVNGGKLLEPPIETFDIRLKSIDEISLVAIWPSEYPKWYRTKTRLHEIPRSARLVFTLYSVRKGLGGTISNASDGSGRERILTTGVNVFDVEGLMVQGEQYVQMLDNLHHCHHGAVPHVVDPEKPLLHMSFTRQTIPVLFDWREGNLVNEKLDRSKSQRSCVLEKTGWLAKKGKSFTFTSWQRRYLILSQKAGTLTYADDVGMSPKGVINLQNATVVAADSLNSKSTESVTSSSTKKEVHTCVFKIKPENSPREYVISASNPQEREEWMTAISIVAQGGIEISEELSPSNHSSNSLENQSECQELDHRSSILRISSGTPSLAFKPHGIALENLRDIMQRDPLYRLNPYEKEILWKFRHEFVNDFDALPRILTCVNWNNSTKVEKIVAMLPTWSRATHPAAYIRLLDMEFANEYVREFAVQKLSEMADTTFSYFLPQLVQALKYENHHVSPLAKHLIKRAIESPNQIGFDLFWSMKVESYNEQYRERYGLLLNTYVDVCSRKMRSILELQDHLFSEKGELEQICQVIKEMKHQKKSKAEMKQVLQELLGTLNETLTTTYQLPIDPRVEVGKILVHKCKIMSSAKSPLWLEFENAEEGGDPVVIIFKAGDDIRQDCLTLQLIRLMDEMWREEGKDLAMEPYKCVSTGPMTGMVQVVLHSVTTAAIHMRKGGVIGAFDPRSFSDWIKANNGDPSSLRNAVDLFLRSAAGYCIATYVLGIGDRHNDNIMMSKQGRYFHIDFGHFLGFMKYQFGVKREQTPFVFTPEMRHVLYIKDGQDEFLRFLDTCCDAFNIVRRHLHLLVSLLQLMIPANMPELRNKDDINYIVQVLKPGINEKDTNNYLILLIQDCMKNKMKSIDNALHLCKHWF